MSRTIEEIKGMRPRFRILIMGRRNAGKKTILKKMCGSDGSDLKIIDPAGNEVDPSILEPNRQRGMSDIENEITFGRNPLFVFHDSRGIEAGAEYEDNSPLRTEYLWRFLRERSETSQLRNQIHAVWFCIPMNEPRTPSEFEVEFFNAKKSPVPIIAVFTKFEALIDAAYADLPQDDSTDTEQAQQARQAAQSKFEETVLKVIEDTKYPPNQFVQLQNLDEPVTGCEALTEKTYAAIQDETLCDLFALAQRNSFRVGCNRILGSIVESGWTARVLVGNREMIKIIVHATKGYMPVWGLDDDDDDRFRYYRFDRDDDDDDRFRYYRFDFFDRFDLFDFRPKDYAPLQSSLEEFMGSIFGDSIPGVSPHISVAVVACIILVSTGEKSRRPIDLLDHTIEVLQTRHNFVTSIKKSVTDARSEFPNKADRAKLVDRLAEIVMKNVDSLRAA